MRLSEPAACRTDRRDFLACAAAAAATGLLGGVRALADDAPPAAAAPLPTILVAGHRLPRLLVGSNPIAGYSYMGREADQQMRDYFTPEQTVAFLRNCERAGIDAHQFSSAALATGVYRTLRESGSKMRLIGLLSKADDIRPTIEAVQPVAAAHHGGVTDRLFREEKAGQVHDFVKAAHDAGLPAGVSAHNPDCIRRIADEGWPVDFFMTCFYYITRPAATGEADEADDRPVLEGPDVGYKFYRDDPAAMCKVIRQVKQPCLAFKVLGAGRLCADQATVREAFRYAFENIKPGDAVIVGMYPRHFDQVGANARCAKELAAG